MDIIEYLIFDDGITAMGYFEIFLKGSVIWDFKCFFIWVLELDSIQIKRR